LGDALDGLARAAGSHQNVLHPGRSEYIDYVSEHSSVNPGKRHFGLTHAFGLACRQNNC
jgi:hypothetical protein